MIIRELPFDEEKALFVAVRRILTPEMRRSSGVAGVQELQNGRHLSRSKQMIIRELPFDEEKALIVTVRRILTPEMRRSSGVAGVQELQNGRHLSRLQTNDNL